MSLSPQNQASVHQLLLAVPEPGSCLLPESSVRALMQLIPCDGLGVGECDSRGYLLRGAEYPDVEADDPQVCDGPLIPGLEQAAALPPGHPHVALDAADGRRDIVRLGFATSSGTVVQLALARDAGVFTERDLAILRMLSPVLGQLMRSTPQLGLDARLTTAEHRVLELVATGWANYEVAEHLCVSVATVRKHLEHCYRKLGVGSRTAAVAVLRSTAPHPLTPEVSRIG